MAEEGPWMGRASRTAALRTWLRSTRREIRERGQGSFARTAAVAASAAATNGAQFAKWLTLGLVDRDLLFTADRFELLDRAVAAVSLEGLWLEFGVFRGASIRHIAERSGHRIVGFDSFQGLPHAWTPRIQAGTFTTERHLPEVPPTVNLVPGWFSETLPAFLATEGSVPVAFLHVDCDLYTSTRTILTALGHRIREGTVVVFDEFCGLLPQDEELAWREFRRERGLRSRWLGCALNGAVGLVVTRRTAVD
jgi:hypothetical protein